MERAPVNVGGQGWLGGTCVASRPRSCERAGGRGQGIFPGHPAAKTLLCICKRAHGIVRPRCHPATAAWEPPARGSFSHGRWVGDDTSAHTRVHPAVRTPCAPWSLVRQQRLRSGSCRGMWAQVPRGEGTRLLVDTGILCTDRARWQACTGTQLPDTRSALAAPGGLRTGHPSACP